MTFAFSWHEDGPFGSVPQTGTRAAGLTYERKVGKLLAHEAVNHGLTMRDHEWMKVTFDDGQSPMWYQPDFVLEAPAGLLIVEAKLTFVEQAFAQLGRYKKVLEQYAQEKRSIVPVLACRNLTPEAPVSVRSFADLCPWSVWHLFT